MPNATLYSLAKAYTEYLSSGTWHHPALVQVAATVAKTDAVPGRDEMQSILSKHALETPADCGPERLDFVLHYVEMALEDHAVLEVELQNVRQLKRLLAVDEGAFWEDRREAIGHLITMETFWILADLEVTTAEEEHQAAVQAVFDLGYDQYVELARGMVERARKDLLARIEEHERPVPVARGLLDRLLGLHAPLQWSEAREERFALARIEAVFPSLAHVDTEPQRTRAIAQSVKDAVWRRDNGQCVQCGVREELEFDHIIPHSRGGANTYRNVQLLCEGCNRSKGALIG